MTASLLATFGMLGLALGLFGIALAGMLLVGGCAQAADETRHNAGLLLVTGTVLLVVGVAGVG